MKKVGLLKTMHESDVSIGTFVSVSRHQRADEEAVVDQGGTSSAMNIHYEKEELEGVVTSVLRILEQRKVSVLCEISINDV